MLKSRCILAVTVLLFGSQAVANTRTCTGWADAEDGSWVQAHIPTDDPKRESATWSPAAQATGLKLQLQLDYQVARGRIDKLDSGSVSLDSGGTFNASGSLEIRVGPGSWRRPYGVVTSLVVPNDAPAHEEPMFTANLDRAVDGPILDALVGAPEVTLTAVGDSGEVFSVTRFTLDVESRDRLYAEARANARRALRRQDSCRRAGAQCRCLG